MVVLYDIFTMAFVYPEVLILHLHLLCNVVIVWSLDLQLPVQAVPITTKVVSLNPVDGEMYSIQHTICQ